MSAAVSPPTKKPLSLLGASRWLKENGFKPLSRQSLYIEIAAGRLKARELMPRVWAVRQADLEAYARRQAEGG